MEKEEAIKYEWVPDRFIDINNELDLSNKTIDHSEYSIIIDNIVLHESFLKNISQTNKPLKIDTQARCIDLKKYRRGDIGGGMTIGYSINKLYRMSFENIDTLNTEDLLDSIIILYAIKQAQNGDEQAINEFVKVYRVKAIDTARKFIESKGLYINPSGLLGYKKLRGKKVEYESITPPNIEEVAQDILRLLISGDRPENILILLKYSGLDKLQFVNTRKLDKLVAIYIKIIVPYVIKIFSEEVTNLVEQFKKSVNDIEKQEIKHKVNVIIEALLIYMLPHSWMMGDPRIRNNRFNPDVFRPTKKTNLTDWLFGKNGRFRKRLSDWFKNENITTQKRSAKIILECPFCHKKIEKKFKGICPNCKTSSSVPMETKRVLHPQHTQDSLDIEIEYEEDKTSLLDTIEDKKYDIQKEEARRYLLDIMKSIPERDIEIFCLHYLDEKKYEEIAKIMKPKLSTKQIGRIIKKTKQSILNKCDKGFLKPLLNQ